MSPACKNEGGEYQCTCLTCVQKLSGGGAYQRTWHTCEQKGGGERTRICARVTHRTQLLAKYVQLPKQDEEMSAALRVQLLENTSIADPGPLVYRQNFKINLKI